jgi:hypothetical protein
MHDIEEQQPDPLGYHEDKKATLADSYGRIALLYLSMPTTR